MAAESTSQPRVRLAEVAGAAGVSVATVSKVLHGHDDVAAATRERVEEVMATLGYRSRAEVRAARARPSVLFILETMGAYSARVLDGVLDEADSQDVAVTVCRAPRRIDASFLIRQVTQGHHLGVVVLTPLFTDADLAYLARRKTPVAMIDPDDLTHTEGISIGSTNWLGGLTATRYLLECGHRRIGLISGPAGRLVARARLHGYRAALEVAQIPYDGTLVRYGPHVTETGRAGGGDLLDLAAPPTAIFATSDAAALGVMQAARARHLSIPDDLSVIGFDDTWAASEAAPPLTTIRQPLGQMGAEALRAVLAQSRHEPLTVHRLELNTELVVRESVAAPRPGL